MVDERNEVTLELEKYEGLLSRIDELETQVSSNGTAVKENKVAIGEADFEMKEKMIKLENEDKKQDAQRHIAWVAISAMCIYPLLSLVIPDSKLDTWGSMSDMIFLSQASIVGMFFGAQAYMSKK